MKVVEIGVVGDVRLLLLLFILELLVVLLLAILFLLHFLAPLMHVEVLVFIVIIRNGALSSMRIKSENLSAHLEGKPAMERSDYEVFPDEHQTTKLGFVVLEEKAAILKVVDKVGVMSGNWNIVGYFNVYLFFAANRNFACFCEWHEMENFGELSAAFHDF